MTDEQRKAAVEKAARAICVLVLDEFNPSEVMVAAWHEEAEAALDAVAYFEQREVVEAAKEWREALFEKRTALANAEAALFVAVAALAKVQP